MCVCFVPQASTKLQSKRGTRLKEQWIANIRRCEIVIHFFGISCGAAFQWPFLSLFSSGCPTIWIWGSMSYSIRICDCVVFCFFFFFSSRHISSVHVTRNHINLAISLAMWNCNGSGDLLGGWWQNGWSCFVVIVVVRSPVHK